MSDVQATFFATLIDEWARAGITDAVVCPGNRSTLFSALLEADERIDVHVIVDERSASFFALGLGKITGRPAIFWCTSGTATAEAHAAVIEANYAQVPLLVCTANRPPELQHSRDWQSIDQSRLYDGQTRWHFEPGVANNEMRSSWRSIAARAVVETVHNPSGPGPVHLDLPIREPWALDVGDIPQGRSGGRPWHVVDAGVTPASPEILERVRRFERGVFIVGEGMIDPRAVHGCAEALGWPVLAEARSYSRIDRPNTVASYDSFLGSCDLAPDVVIRLGTAPISKSVPAWVSRSGAQQWFVDQSGVWNGSADEADVIVQADPTLFCVGLAETSGTPNLEWLASWQQLERTTQKKIEESHGEAVELTEPVIARCLSSELPVDTNLFAATSMPVRDVEAFAPTDLQPFVYANRGASGMDGLISTAAGIAAGSQKSTVLLIGDLSFLYDLNALWALRNLARPIKLTIVIVDNNGGGIFSRLPQLNNIPSDVFERVVATPQTVDIPSIVEAMDISCERVSTKPELMKTVDATLDDDRINVVYISTNRN